MGEEDAAEGNHHSRGRGRDGGAREGASSILISAAIEAEIAASADSGDDKQEFLETLGSGGNRLGAADPPGLRPAGPADVLHGGTKGGPRVDRAHGLDRPASRRRDPHGLRAGLHPR